MLEMTFSFGYYLTIKQLNHLTNSLRRINHGFAIVTGRRKKMFHNHLPILDPAMAGPIGLGRAVGLSLPMERSESNQHEQCVCLCPLDCI